MTLTQVWHRTFLDKRPSLSLGLFRLAVAFTVGAHMIPSFFHMDENFLSTAFKTKNFNFFTIGILQLVERSPDGVVWLFLVLFYASLTTFALGFYSQLSCILMTLSCYYFYALNNFQIGTLSFDILLVTLFLLCVTNYHGDFLSLDSLRRGKEGTYKRLKPYFIQRLLQLQVAWTFWYTALSKITAGGNWLTDNPYYYLMRYPPIGVVRDFPLRQSLAQQPTLCYWLGLSLLVFEFILPFLWFIPPPVCPASRRGQIDIHAASGSAVGGTETGGGIIPRIRTVARPLGITLGIVFQFMLWATLQVPTIFLFLFPPLMLLFINPETLVWWIEARQAANAARGRGILLYDGQCGFCLESVKRLRILDLFGWVDPLDFHMQPDLSQLHPTLTPERCRSEMILLEPTGGIWGGFDAFRRLCRHLPFLMPFLPLVSLPGARWVGTRVYRWVADHRYLLHRNPLCQTNHCALREAGNGSSSTSFEGPS